MRLLTTSGSGWWPRHGVSTTRSGSPRLAPRERNRRAPSRPRALRSARRGPGDRVPAPDARRSCARERRRDQCDQQLFQHAISSVWVAIRCGSGRITQPARERFQQRPRDLGVFLHERTELPGGEPVAAQIGGGDDRCRAGALVETGGSAPGQHWGNARHGSQTNSISGNRRRFSF